MIERKLGWKKQKPDNRDLTIQNLKMASVLPTVLPPAVNLRKWCSPVEDQNDLGSCTANAWSGILEFNQNKYPISGSRYFDLSRLFIYYNERVLEDTVNEDSGAELRDGARAINIYGVCPEYKWPYITSKFAVEPSSDCYAAALPNHIHNYYALNTFNDLKTSLAGGHPFVFGIAVYDSFLSDAVANTGIVPMPNQKTERIRGGHAIMCVGYNNYEGRFLIRNSWGKEWGLKGTNAGYCTLPYDYLANSHLASDFWTSVKET